MRDDSNIAGPGGPIDDEIVDLLYGELSDERAAELERAVQADADRAASLSGLRQMRTLFNELPD